MFRDVMAICIGTLAMFFAITAIAILNIKYFSAPVALSSPNHVDLVAVMAALPSTVKLLIVASWCVGAFVGAAVAARIAEHRMTVASLIATANIVFTLINARSVPYPQWMILAGVLLPLPLAWLATRIVPGHAPTPQTAERWRGK
jgi:hypothetical protein